MKLSLRLVLTFSIIFTSLFGFSQVENFNYEQFSNPNRKNDLAKHFSKTVKKKYLRSIRFPKKSNLITLHFTLDADKKPTEIEISGYQTIETSEAILNSFREYPLKKLGIKNLDRKKRYSLQIISKKGTKNIFNVSSKIIEETPSVMTNCNDLNYYDDIKDCVNIAIEKHLYNTLNFTMLSEIETTLFIKIVIDKDGKLYQKDSKVPSFFNAEIDRALSIFPKIKEVATVNNLPKKVLYNVRIKVKKGLQPTYSDKYRNLEQIGVPSTENELSSYLRNKISEKWIEKADLNRIESKLFVYFQLNNLKEPILLSSNARNKELEKKIFNALEEYPIKKLHFIDPRKFNQYFLQILSFENGKTIVKTSTKLTSERVPIFPGCEKSSDIDAVRNCLSKNIQMHFIRKFNSDLPKLLGYPKGRKRIWVSFKINTQGTIDDVEVKNVHMAIIYEIKRILLTLPKLEPAKQLGKNVNSSFNFPFTLIVE
ncbi:hypothetical protein [Polaribacter tangerinus]|uniref:hypothetical protein n=1 Tax=Polaribacter tangerinus TaxID=1920034 RepID=UPI000B4BE3EB|nr:hypothetical protein [Polaribacter tangerinus]